MSTERQFTTISGMFTATTGAFAGKPNIAVQYSSRRGVVSWTHDELRRITDAFANGLLALGAVSGDRIGIIAENRPEWIVADQAILAIGASDVPIFPSLTAEQAKWIFTDAGVSIVVVSNDYQVKKILSIADELPYLRAIIMMNDDAASTNARVISFHDVQRQGERYAALHPEYLSSVSAKAKPEDIATIIYTSGTTGTPKGVTLTHSNLVFDLCAAVAALPQFDARDVFFSYLPLCHSFERIAYYFMLACGVRIVLAESVETVAEHLPKAQPTIVTTVPRLFERMHSRILKSMESAPPRSRKIFAWSLATGIRYKSHVRNGKTAPWLRVQYAVADRLVFAKLRARLGGRIRFFVSGGAPLPLSLAEFFDAAGILILEGYGLTECSPVISVNPYNHNKFGTVGKPLPGVEVTIAPDGEILTRGMHVMRGYWRDEEATREAIDNEGWMHTGDIGELDSDGYLKITDRKKHLFVSSGGKNIAPQHIEALLLESPLIDQAIIIGDRMPFITALIVPGFDALREKAKSIGIESRSERELVAAVQIHEAMEREIAVRMAGLANYERVRRFTLLSAPFAAETGELTPTMKVRRAAVEKKFKREIENMYRNDIKAT